VSAYWLKAIGHARGPLDERWLDDRAVEALASTAR
jgi:hypothetical protein